MSLPKNEIFYADLVGTNGPAQQLLAFRCCWEKGENYLRAIRQAAIGATGLCGDNEEARAEVESLRLIAADVVVWFESAAKELERLEIMARNGAEVQTELTEGRSLH